MKIVLTGFGPFGEHKVRIRGHGYIFRSKYYKILMSLSKLAVFNINRL